MNVSKYKLTSVRNQQNVEDYKLNALWRERFDKTIVMFRISNWQKDVYGR